jgi:hypothetical protein
MTRRGQWYPTSDQKRVRYPDFLYAAPPMVACAAFFEESRMKFGDSTKPHRKSGGTGHPGSIYSGKIPRKVSLHLLGRCRCLTPLFPHLRLRLEAVAGLSRKSLSLQWFASTT